MAIKLDFFCGFPKILLIADIPPNRKKCFISNINSDLFSLFAYLTDPSAYSVDHFEDLLANHQQSVLEYKQGQTGRRSEDNHMENKIYWQSDN